MKKDSLLAIRIEKQYIQQLETIAKKQERSLSFIVRKIIINELEK